MEKFDRNNPNWSEDPNLNFMFLRYAEDYLNRLLVARGYLYLRDVYEYLGIPCNPAIIREKHLNDILWTKNKWFELEILQRDDCILIGFLNAIN